MMMQNFFVLCCILLLFVSICVGDDDEDKVVHLVTITTPSKNVSMGESILFSGAVDPTLYDKTSTVLFMVHPPGKSRADLFDTIPVQSGGTFTHSVPADALGEWGFEAKYQGKGSNILTIDVRPPDEKKKTTLSISPNPANPRVGDDVKFTGVLESNGKGVPDREITYQMAQPRQNGCFGLCGPDEVKNWRAFGSAKTDAGGRYLFNLPVVESGVVNIRALFAGDGIFERSTTDVLSFTIA